MVRSDTSTPTLPNSPWIRGAPQSGFAAAIWVTSVRMVASVLGRPTRIRAARRVHRRRSHSRCHRTTVSGWTSTSAARQCRHVCANAIQNRRSRLRSCGRQPVRFKVLSCWRSALHRTRPATWDCCRATPAFSKRVSPHHRTRVRSRGARWMRACPIWCCSNRGCRPVRLVSCNYPIRLKLLDYQFCVHLPAAFSEH